MVDKEVIPIQNISLKKSREKSVRYPAYTLKECLDFLSIVHTIGGKKEAPVESILSKLNITSSENKRYKYLTSSAEIFGLIVKTDRGVTPTETGISILYPPDGEEQRKKLLIAVFKSPQLYQKIIERYDQMIIPNTNALKGVFLQSGIASKALDNAIEVFINSAQFAGVLNSDNRLIVSDFDIQEKPLRKQPAEQSDVDYKQPEQSPSVPKNTTCATNNDSPKQDSDYYKLEIPTSSGKITSIILPKDAVKDDIELIINLLKVVQVKPGVSNE